MPGVIAGSALMVGPGTLLDAGSHTPGRIIPVVACTYQLTNMDLSGRSNFSVAVTPELISNSPAGQPSNLFNNLGASPATGTAQREWSGSR